MNPRRIETNGDNSSINILTFMKKLEKREFVKMNKMFLV